MPAADRQRPRAGDAFCVEPIGAVLVYAQLTAAINPPVIILAIGSAVSLVLIEVVYVLKRVISPIYLEDASVELILIIWWAVSLLIS